MTTYPPRPCTPPDQVPSQDQVHPPGYPRPGTPHHQVHPPAQCMLEDTGNKRAVRIRLECILVLCTSDTVINIDRMIPKISVCNYNVSVPCLDSGFLGLVTDPQSDGLVRDAGMSDWKYESGGYRGYDPSAIPKRFQLREGLSLGFITDTFTAISENVQLKTEEIREGVRGLLVRVSSLCACVYVCVRGLLVRVSRLCVCVLCACVYVCMRVYVCACMCACGVCSSG